jgi:hypothetical protein
MPGDSRRNREDLVKSELEYFNFSESEEGESLEEKDEDRSLVKRRDFEDNDGDPKEISPNNNIMIIKNALKLDICSSKSEEAFNNSTPNNSKNIDNVVKGLTAVKTIFFSLFLMSSVLVFQELWLLR